VALLDEGCDVDDEAGPDIGIEAGIYDFEGAVRVCACVDLGKAGEEAGLVAEGGYDGVVGA
jgi:hypothetical protein